MVKIRNEFSRDIDAREALLDRVWGPARWQKTAERLREGRKPAEGLSFVAEENGCLTGTVRLWRVCAGPARPALPTRCRSLLLSAPSRWSARSSPWRYPATVSGGCCLAAPP